MTKSYLRYKDYFGKRDFSLGTDLFLNNQESIINNQGTPQDNSLATLYQKIYSSGWVYHMGNVHDQSSISK